MDAVNIPAKFEVRNLKIYPFLIIGGIEKISTVPAYAHTQWRQREFKVGGDEAPKEVGVRSGFPLSTGNTPSLLERSLGGANYFCFVI